MPPIYLDHHATTPVDPRVFEAMRPYFCDAFGNAASLNHWFGRQAADAVEAARAQIAAALRVEPRSLVFTSGATEANNLAVKGTLRALGSDRHVITTAAEHRSVLDPVRRIQRSSGPVTILPVDSFGCVDPDAVRKALTPQTALVSAIWANNEVGSLNAIEEIGHLCREKGVLFHTDATQALGRIDIDLSRLPIDLLSASAHKLYGPKGVGILYVRRGSPRIRIEPLFDGGGHEQHLRSGTLPVPLIVGFGRACALATEEGPAEQLRIAALRDRLWRGLSAGISDLVLNGCPTRRLAGNLNVSVPDVDGEALMTSLTRIAVSSGSACTTAEPEPSHVLRAMGRSDLLTRSSLRFGIGRYNTVEEIDAAIAHVIDTVECLRSVDDRR